MKYKKDDSHSGTFARYAVRRFTQKGSNQNTGYCSARLNSLLYVAWPLYTCDVISNVKMKSIGKEAR